MRKSPPGEISIDGAVVNKLEPRDRGCSMVFQNYALYPHMNVAANIGYALKVAGVPRAERDRRIVETARIVGLEELLDRKPAQLSGGQRQRVAMGRAIIREPKVFLFDEPLSNLDAKLRVQMRVEIRRLHKRLSATSVFVTHDQVEAMTLADKLIVMNKGHVEQVGTPLEIYHRPRTRFVGTFIGSPAMNFFDSTIATKWQIRVARRYPIGDRPGTRPRQCRQCRICRYPSGALPPGYGRNGKQRACDRRFCRRAGFRPQSFTSRSTDTILPSPWR